MSVFVCVWSVTLCVRDTFCCRRRLLVVASCSLLTLHLYCYSYLNKDEIFVKCNSWLLIIIRIIIVCYYISTSNSDQTLTQRSKICSIGLVY